MYKNDIFTDNISDKENEAGERFNWRLAVRYATTTPDERSFLYLSVA